VGDTGFELVTSSVSGQNLCLGMRAGVASAACGRSLMSVTVRVGWPTVWPTANRLPLRVVVMRACPRPALCGFLGHFGRPLNVRIHELCEPPGVDEIPAQPRIEFEKHATEHCFSAVGWKPGHARSLDEPLAATTR
jgi:hypothetical protein